MKRLNLQKKNILVIGDVMLDCYYTGKVNRISPEAPIPIFEKKDEHYILGGAANVAANLVAAGQNVSLMSVIGKDNAAEIMRKLLRDNGIKDIYVVDSDDRKTTVKTRILGQNTQPLLRIDVEDKVEISKEYENILLDKLLKNLHQFDLVVLSDYLKGVLSYTFTQEVIKMCKEANKKVVVDVKDSRKEKYKGAFLLKPNRNELHILSGNEADTLEDIRQVSNKLCQECENEYVLTTLGAEGMMLVDSKGNNSYVECEAKEVFDVTGAGDTVLAYLSLGIANNMDVLDAVKLSNFAAGIKVSKKGTAAIRLDEVLDYIQKEKYKKSTEKIVSVSELQKKLKQDIEGDVVFTNGCFDILHVGHIRYLKKAASLGDMLIVGINSDASVKRLKGESRPIVPENDRMEVIASLEFVDYVVMFDEDTPYNLINQIQPDILVKGADYRIEDVVGRDIVEAKGGHVELIKFEDGKSTTNIVKKILENGR